MSRYSFSEDYLPLQAAYGLQDIGVPMPYGGMVMRYTLATLSDALALHDAAAQRMKQDTVITINGIRFTEVTYPLEWCVPFVRARCVHNRTTTFYLHSLLDSRHDLSTIRNVVHTWVEKTLGELEKRRRVTSESLTQWREPVDYTPPPPGQCMPIPTSLKALWAQQKPQKKQ